MFVLHFIAILRIPRCPIRPTYAVKNMSSLSHEDITELLSDLALLIDARQENEHRFKDGVTLVPGLDMPAYAQLIREYAADLSSGQFVLVVAGDFNNGKSTLLNALLRNNVLPMGAIATTAVITRIFSGDREEITLCYTSGEKKTLDVETFSQEYQLNRNGEDDSNKVEAALVDVNHIDIRVPTTLFASGVSLIDTPGLMEHQRRTQLVLDYLPKAHSILVVIDAQRPMTRDEREFIHLLGEGILPHVFFVVNRFDLVQEDGRENVRSFVRKRLAPYFTDHNGRFDEQLYEERVFFTNARQALEARLSEPEKADFYLASGVEPLEGSLMRFLLGASRHEASYHSIARSLTAIRYVASQRIHLVQESLGQPLETLQKKQADVKERAESMRSASNSICERVSELGGVVKYQVYGNLLDYVEEMRRSWSTDVDMLDLEALSNYNIMSNRLKKDQQKKEEFANLLKDELNRYIEVKLVQWAQRLPGVIAPSIEGLLEDIRSDVALFNVKLDQFAEWFAGGAVDNRILNRQHASLVPLSDTQALLQEGPLGQSMLQGVGKTVMQGVSDVVNDPDMLRTIGYNALSALLMVAAFALGPAAGIGTLFAVILGRNLVDTFRMRHEQKHYMKQFQEEVHVDRALGDMGQEKVARFREAVRGSLVDDLHGRLFDEIRNKLTGQREKIFEGVEAEFKRISDQLGSQLNEHVQQVVEVQKGLIEHKEQGQGAVNAEINRMQAILSAFDVRFEAICTSVYGRVLTEEEINAVGEQRAVFLDEYATSAPIIEIPEQTLDEAQLKAVEHADRTVEKTESVDESELESAVTQRIQRAIASVMGLPAEASKVVSEEDARLPSIKLARLIGLGSVKKRVIELVDYQAEVMRRQQSGYSGASSAPLHLVFTGNPGTGKTTVAEIVGELYKKIGLLNKGHVVTASRNELIGQYIGHTAPRTRQVIERALDGVLFIDEAYSLAQNAGPHTDFGAEAIAELLQAMERYRDRLAVVVAGYPDPMKQFLESNPGLTGRFPRGNHIHFPDYTPAELMLILKKIIEDEQHTLDPEAQEKLTDIIEGLYLARNEHFSNAREMREMAKDLIMCRASRTRKDATLPVNEPIRVEDIPDRFDSYARAKREEGEVSATLRELDELIGLQPVKSAIRRLVSRMKMERKLGRTLKVDTTLHMIFVGSPGTGKTTVAQKFGRILADLGYLRKGHLVEARSADLVAGFIGQTAPQTRSVVEKALDGVLFVDEAYALASKGQNSFGEEAIAELLACMEEYRDRLVVIMAGYPNEMRLLVDSNSGLRSRFRPAIEFPDFQADELMEILDLMTRKENLTMSSAARGRIDLHLQALRKQNPRQFGNARNVRVLLEQIIEKMAERMDQDNLLDGDQQGTITLQIEAEDVPELPEVLVSREEEPAPRVITVEGGKRAAVLHVQRMIEKEDIAFDFDFLPPAAERSR